MNYPIKLTPIILKASLLATVLFWTLDISAGYYDQISPLMILSIIPILILCSLAIWITIMPFFWLKSENISADAIFKKYFPCYSIIAFGLCSYFIIASNFANVVCVFFITAFFTLMQSWVWICKILADVQKKNTNPEGI
tara:strand:+ start:743 stop:1159 length:417 start_codon:yes stop_codon:yes gene_type:complete